jgi:hypothetical protein
VQHQKLNRVKKYLTLHKGIGIIIVSLAILFFFLYLHLRVMPVSSSILGSIDNVKIELQGNQDFLIFYGVLFLTCVTGILTMIPHFKEATWGERKVLSSIYVGLLCTMLVSILNSWDILRENSDLFNSGLLGNEWNTYLHDRGLANQLHIFDNPLNFEFSLTLLLSIVLVIFELLLLIKCGWLKRESEPPPSLATTPTSPQSQIPPAKASKPDDESLIAEYTALNDATWARGNNNLLVFSIIIPATLAAVLFTIQFRGSLGMTFAIPNAVFIPLACSLLIFVSKYELWTSQKIDNVCFDRLVEIEKELRIGGNTYVRNHIKEEKWYRIRKNLWLFVLAFFMILYLIIAWRLLV